METRPIELISKELKENNDVKMIDIKTFDVFVDNKNFKFDFGKNENKNNIIFKIYEEKKFINKIFFLSLNFDNFHNLNPIFKFYQTIDEIYNFVLDILISKKFSIISKQNSVNLTLQVSMPGGKIIDINFTLLENEIKKEEIIKKLLATVEELIKENKIIKDELIKKNDESEIIKNDLKLLKEENIQIKNRLQKCEEYIMEKKQKENNICNFFNKSNIVKDYKEKKELINWISTNGNIKEINLLYKASEDGDKYEIFYDKCRNKGSIITLIKTKKGRRFGGFSKAELTLNFTQNKITDKNAFLFSLNNMKKYNILKPDKALICADGKLFLGYGNNCDGKGIYFHTEFFKNKNFENQSTRVFDVSSDYCLSGEDTFIVEEFEAYQIVFK